MLPRSQVSELLDSLRRVYTEVEMLTPETPPPEELKTIPPPGREDDETTLAYIEMLKTATDEDSRSAALSGLMDLHGDAVEKHLRSYRTRVYSLDPEALDDIRNQIWIAISKEVVSGRYDPERMKFYELASKLAHTIAGRQAAKVVDRKKKELAVASIGPETEDFLKAKEVKHAAQLTPQEQTLAREIKDYLVRVLEGREPFPYRVRPRGIPPGATPEERERRRKEWEATILDIFLSHYGLGRPRLSSVELEARYGLTKNEQNSLMDTVKKAILPWVQRHAERLKRLGVEEPEKTYWRMWVKLSELIGRKAGRFPIVEQMDDHLFALLDIVRYWNAFAVA
jgi:hypothetical protein